MFQILPQFVCSGSTYTDRWNTCQIYFVTCDTVIMRYFDLKFPINSGFKDQDQHHISFDLFVGVFYFIERLKTAPP